MKIFNNKRLQTIVIIIQNVNIASIGTNVRSHHPKYKANTQQRYFNPIIMNTTTRSVTTKSTQNAIKQLEDSEIASTNDESSLDIHNIVNTEKIELS